MFNFFYQICVRSLNVWLKNYGNSKVINCECRKLKATTSSHQMDTLAHIKQTETTRNETKKNYAKIMYMFSVALFSFARSIFAQT